MPRVGVKVFHKRTRRERREARKGLSLLDAGVSDKTHCAYFAALTLLLPYIEDIQNEAELDAACAQWVEMAWEDGESLYTVGNALSGLHFYEPLTKRKIPSAWKHFATWKKLEWPARAPPLTLDLVMAMSYYAVCHHDLIFACLLALGFFTLLRTGELLHLTGRDLLVNSKQLVISLKDTKSGKRNAAGEMVTSSHFFPILLVSTLVDVLTAQGALDKRLWGYTGQAFREHFDSYLRRFRITQLGFRPYSLRRGGATWVVQTTGSMELALLKGRWQSHKVARLYIADGVSKLPDLLLPEKNENAHSSMESTSMNRRKGGPWKEVEIA